MGWDLNLMRRVSKLYVAPAFECGNVATVVLLRTMEAIHIRRRQSMNLDCGLRLSPVWNPLLDATKTNQIMDRTQG